MFGYIRPMKPQLKFCEYDLYRGIYCGLCKEMGRQFGLSLRFTLSYDFVFLTLLLASFRSDGSGLRLVPERCIAHPLKKNLCACFVPEKEDEFQNPFTYPAAAAVISLWHKLQDDRSDAGFLKKAFAGCSLVLFQSAYQKAQKLYPDLANTVEIQMKRQAQLETEKIASIDQAADPTAQITAALLEHAGFSGSQKRVMSRFGYLLGRYIYFADALDDLQQDFQNHNYNPLLLLPDIQKKDELLPMENLRQFALDQILLTLGDLANAYVLLDIKCQYMRPVLDNIVYLGLRNTAFSLPLQKQKKKNSD